MKKLIVYFMVLALVTSCANHFSIQKRKYTKGFYFAHTGSKSRSIKTEITHQPKNSQTASGYESAAPITVVSSAPTIKEIPNKKVTEIAITKTKVLHHLKNNSPIALSLNSSKIKSSLIGKSETKQVLTQQRVIKKVIRILLRIVATILLIGAGLCYALSLADSTFFIFAVILAAGAVVFILLSLLLKAT